MNFLEKVTAVAGPAKVEKTVDLGDGKSIDLLIRKLGAAEAEAMFLGVDKDPKKNKGLRDKLIAACVSAKNEDGTEVQCTLEEAKQLTNDVSNALQAVCFEVNGIGLGKEGSGDGSGSSTS